MNSESKTTLYADFSLKKVPISALCEALKIIFHYRDFFFAYGDGDIWE